MQPNTPNGSVPTGTAENQLEILSPDSDRGQVVSRRQVAAQPLDWPTFAIASRHHLRDDA